MPLASIIIPVFDGRRFICEAVSCALGQTHPDKEVIVIDDASTDGTAELLFDQFGQRFGTDVHYFRNPRNRERARSRNRGAEEARGEFLFFLDYDDLWKPDYLEMALAAFPGHDIVYSFPRSFIDEHGAPQRSSRKRIDVDPGCIVFGSQIGYPSGSAFRRKSFPGYRSYCLLREDWEIYLRAWQSGLRIRILDNDRVLMRSHAHRSSASVKFWSSTLKVQAQHAAGVPADYRGAFLHHLSDVCLRYGDLVRGWRFFLQGVIAEPSSLLRARRWLDFLKRAFRIDKYFRYRGERSELRL